MKLAYRMTLGMTLGMTVGMTWLVFDDLSPLVSFLIASGVMWTSC